MSNDYNSRDKPIVLIDNCETLIHASKVYTWIMFSKLWDEFLQVVSQKNYLTYIDENDFFLLLFVLFVSLR